MVNVNLDERELKFLKGIFDTFDMLPFSALLGKLVKADKETFKQAKDIDIIKDLRDKINFVLENIDNYGIES